MPAVIRHPDQLSAAWLGHVLQQPVQGFSVTAGHGHWSHQWRILARLADGRTRALRLKVCLGPTFGRSEVDYYTRDYRGLADAPLVHCHDARYDPAVGYHLLLDDLADTHDDRRDAPPSLAHGLALAGALAALHRHHWGRPPPAVAALDRYFDEIRPGLAPLRAATGHDLRPWFDQHEAAMRQRWAQPQGMALLHGDANPTNVLTPAGAEAPVLLLDRQPFDWSLTCGLAVHDLAYATVPWWPEATRQAHEAAVLRHWHHSLAVPGYPWDQAVADWRLAVAQCLHVPLEWCSKPDTVEAMRWLWQRQLQRVLHALASPGSDLA